MRERHDRYPGQEHAREDLCSFEDTQEVPNCMRLIGMSNFHIVNRNEV
jgi:hypothetical protein